MSEERALTALDAAGIEYQVTRHGRVGSLAEAAALRGVDPDRIVKTLVVRRADDDYVLVLVPGDRQIHWPALRALLGVSRLSLPPAEDAFAATGYERGTITPFGSSHPWPVVVDERVTGLVSMGPARTASPSRCRPKTRSARCRPQSPTSARNRRHWPM